MESKNHSESKEALLPSPLSKVVALAASAGGLEAISRILSGLPRDFPAAIVVLLHRTDQMPNLLAEILSQGTLLPVRIAEEGDALRPGNVFVAPPGRHLLVGPDATLTLSDSVKVNHVRPSADRLFESLAVSLKERAIAVVLTGHLTDGSGGVPAVKKMGGVVIAQDAATAAASGMPAAAIATGMVDLVLLLDGIAPALIALVAKGAAEG